MHNHSNDIGNKIDYKTGAKIFNKILEPLLDDICDKKVIHSVWTRVFRNTTLNVGESTCRNLNEEINEYGFN